MTVRRISTDQEASLLDDLLGSNVFVRSVTFHYTGKLVAADDSFLLLEDASWIADSGRFSEALAHGSLNEVEPFPGSCFVARGAIVDVSHWQHELPRQKK
jgi:hypothetical protein